MLIYTQYYLNQNLKTKLLDTEKPAQHVSSIRTQLGASGLAQLRMELEGREEDRPIGERFDAALNPEHTLPQVNFEPMDEATRQSIPVEGGAGYTVMDSDSNAVGVFLLGDGKEVDGPLNSRYLKWVSVNAAGQGFGMAIYKKLFEQAQAAGVTMVSDRQLSKGGMKMWLRFQKAGIAEQQTPYEYSQEGEDYLADSSIFRAKF